MTAPSYQPVQLTPALSIHGPLIRRYKPAPGLVMIQDAGTEATPPISRQTLDPEPHQKWAEEGYFVARIEVSGLHALGHQNLLEAVTALEQYDDCVTNNIGIIVYSASAVPALTTALDPKGDNLAVSGRIKGVVSYGSLPGLAQPYLCHLAENGVKSTSGNKTIYRYPEVQSTSFILPTHPDYLPASAAVAHSRSLEFLKKQLGGPWFDLEAIWEEHTRLEFADRAVEETMNTMVAEPYVNHVPTMTGGIGRENLTSFYAKHFIFSNPDDTELQLISRTIGIDRVVDEFIFSLTHDRVIDWL